MSGLRPFGLLWIPIGIVLFGALIALLVREAPAPCNPDVLGYCQEAKNGAPRERKIAISAVLQDASYEALIKELTSRGFSVQEIR